MIKLIANLIACLISFVVLVCLFYFVVFLKNTESLFIWIIGMAGLTVLSIFLFTFGLGNKSNPPERR